MWKRIACLVMVLGTVAGVLIARRSHAQGSGDLTLTSIVPTFTCGIDGCSGYFDNYTCNSGTNDPSFSVGSNWTGGGTVSSCTGNWDSTDTASLVGNQCKYVRTYGPGYVGPKVSYGANLTVTSYADIYCQVSESNEANNSKTSLIQVQ